MTQELFNTVLCALIYTLQIRIVAPSLFATYSFSPVLQAVSPTPTFTSQWKAAVAATSQLRDTLEKYLAQDMAKPTKEEVEKAFAKCNKDGNGKLTMNEFKAALLEIKHEGVEKEMVEDDETMEMVMDMMDGDGDKMISLNELLKILDIDEKMDYFYEKEMLKRVIKAADKDGNGFLSAAELKECMLELELEDEDDEDIDNNVNMFFMMADADGDRKLKIEEVISFLKLDKTEAEKMEKDPKEKMKTMFRMCDCDEDGFISKKEIVQFLKTMGFVDEDDTPAEVKMVINMTMSMADEDEDGKLNYEEFCTIMDK